LQSLLKLNFMRRKPRLKKKLIKLNCRNKKVKKSISKLKQKPNLIKKLELLIRALSLRN